MLKPVRLKESHTGFLVSKWLSEIKSSVACKSEGKVRLGVDSGSIRGRFGIDSRSSGVDSGLIRGRFGVDSFFGIGIGIEVGMT